MLQKILLSTPSWVWVLLIFLLYRGVIALYDREVPYRKAIVIPLLMLVLSLHGLNGQFQHNPLVLPAAFLAGLIAAVLAWMAAGRNVALRPEGMLFLRGSWIPLLMMIVIFSVKYAVNVLQAMQSPLLQGDQAALTLGGIYGLFAGAALGRVLRILMLREQARQALARLHT